MAPSPTAIRVLALVPYPPERAPGQRYRIEQWASTLRDEGCEIVLSPFLDAAAMDILYSPGHHAAKVWGALCGYARRLRDLRRAGAFDLAFVYREAAPIGPPWIERILSRRLPIVYDFDDAIYLPAASTANAWASALKRPAKTGELCALARHVTVGNETLAAFARPLAKEVTVIPSTIDTALYGLRSTPRASRPVVGWTGSVTTLPHLATLGPALRRLRGLVDYELRLIGGSLDSPGVDVVSVPWRAVSEADDLRAIDVGLMPLPDDEWCRGKCAMKALQYMALGIPPVVSPVGVNARLVVDGVNGFHATTEDEWVDRILRLLRDSALRERVGNAARQTVQLGYSATVQAPRLAGVLRETAR